jgi:isopenicillin N synthase-like dioxygenase
LAKLNSFRQVGGELTLGRADHKEGLYFGTEMDWDEAKGKPMHGPNLWPDKIPELKPTVPFQFVVLGFAGNNLFHLR